MWLICHVINEINVNIVKCELNFLFATWITHMLIKKEVRSLFNLVHVAECESILDKVDDELAI